MRRRVVLGLVVAGALALLLAAARLGPATGPGRMLIASLATGLPVGDLGVLKVEAVGGDPWSRFTLGQVEIADRRGVWFAARDIAIDWRPAALLRRRLWITSASAGSMSLLRPPVPRTGPGGGGRSPVAVRLDRFVASLSIDPRFAGTRGDYRLDTAVDLERDGAASGRLAALSLTRPGDFLRIGLRVGPGAINLEAHAREATGGALGGSLGLDPRQPFLLDAAADGAPRRGAFSLTARVGDTTPAMAAGQWAPAGAEASGRLDLAASRWLAPWRAGVGPVATFRLTAASVASDLYRLGLEVRGNNLLATANGEVDPAHRRTGPGGVALAVTVDDLSTLAAIPGLGAARANGRLTGDDGAWRLSGTAFLDRARRSGLGLTRIQAPFELAAARGGIDLRVQATAAADSGNGPMAALLGPAPRATAEIEWLAGGRVLWRRLSAHGAALDLEGQGEQGLFGALGFSGTAQIRGLAGLAPGASGAVTADWRASQARDTAPWAFGVHARGQGLHLDSAEAGGLLGPAPELQANGRLGSEGLAIEKAVLTGGAGALSAAGTVGPGGELRVKLGWAGQGPLALGPVTITGPSRADGDLTGALDAPRLEAAADIKVIDLPDLPGLRPRDAHLTLSLAAGGQTLNGRAGLSAASDSGPVRASAAFRGEPRQIVVSDIDVDVAGAAVRGGATLIGGTVSLADLTGTVTKGLFLGRGRAEAGIRIAPAADGPHAHVSITATGAANPDDSWAIDTLKVSADGPLRRLPYQIDLRGQAAGLGARLKGSGVVSALKGDRSASFNGGGRLGAVDFLTVAPAELSLPDSGVIGALRLSVGGGHADVTLAQNGARLNGRAVVTGLDLGLLDTDIRGRGDGVLTLVAVDGALNGTARAEISGLTERDLTGSAPMEGALNATFGGGVIAVEARLSDPRGSRISADARLPATLSSAPFQVALDNRRPLSGHFSADGQIGPLWDLMEGGGRTLSGHLAAQGTIAGTLADPRLTGAASVEDGDFEDSAVGLRLKGLVARAAMRGDSIDVAQFAATDGEKGAITGSGAVSLLRGGASGFRIGLRAFRLIDNSLGQATASGSVDVARAADGKVRLGGALVIDRAQISPAAPTASGVTPMEVVEIHRTQDDETVSPPPVVREPPVALDINLKSPGGIFIKGRGLNLELALDARVSGATDAPALTGVARVVRGDYDFAGKRFQVDDRSEVFLGSSIDAIRLDMTATRDDPTLTAVIRISGKAAVPTLALSSTPALPKDEILSQVLFGASAAQLSGLQAAQLASAVAGLAGNGGFDVIGGLRGFAHLDRLAIDSGAATGFGVAGGKYISDKVYVEISGGGRAGQGAQVEWRLKKHVAIVSRVTSQGDHAVSVRWRKDY